MNRNDIIRMAREAGIKNDCDGVWCNADQLERFAALVAAASAAKEREACAKVCEDIENDQWALYKGRPPYKGNEDGRADTHVHGVSDGAGMCAAAIRARGETTLRGNT